MRALDTQLEMNARGKRSSPSQTIQRCRAPRISLVRQPAHIIPGCVPSPASAPESCACQWRSRSCLTIQKCERSLAVGALRRVYKRRNGRERSQVRRHRSRVDDEDSSAAESDGDEGSYGPVTQKTTNHYTLNMAGPGAQSDLPFRLLG